jgi:ribose 5-phosphate isomerase B
MKLLIGSDKSGFLLKEAVKAYYEAEGYTVEDVGTQDVENPKAFHGVAPIVAKKVVAGEYDKAILVCGTGMGMSVVANKFEGIRAACVESVYAAEKCRAINDANILCMGGWLIGPEMGLEMAKKFMNTGFTEGLEDWRAKNLVKAREVVLEIEKENFNK